MRQTKGATQVVASRGRPFPKGNAGRPRGSRNRTTVILGALLDGEGERLLRKGIEIALDGDVVMLKFFLERLLPREPAIDLGGAPRLSDYLKDQTVKWE